MVTRVDKPRSPTRRVRSRRPAERGAAVFIVVMVLTLLTAVGIFAVRSASLADLAAGYDREASQASLIAQYATVAAAAFMATSTADSIITNMNPPNLYCQSNKGVMKPCFKMSSGLIESSTLAQGNENLFETSSPSLNANGTTSADFMLEMTDPVDPGTPGHGDPHAPIQITFTAVAQVRPIGACGTNGAGQTWNAGQQVMRSYISAGNQLSQ